MLRVLLLLKSLVRVFQNMVHKNGFRKVGIGECARQDVGLQLLGKHTLHVLLHELLEETIEKEEGLPNINAHLN